MLCGGILLRRKVSRWARMNKCSTSGSRNPNAILNVIVFLLSSLVTAPSFVSVSLLVMILFVYKGFQKKSRNQKYLHLSFIQYLETWTS